MSNSLTKLTGRQSTRQPLPEDSELEQFFTDAEQARQLFEDLVRSAPLPKRLLIIHGVGGVGKSTLLKMYRLSCYRHRFPVALIGAENTPSSVDVLAGWAEDLSSTGVRLRAFRSTLDHYRALQAQVEAKAEKAGEAMRGAAGELGKAAAKIAVEMAASAIPVVGPLAAALGGAGAEAAIDWLRGFLNKPDLEFYLDPSQRLTDDFLSDLARATARQRSVLLMDTYERMAALGDWVRDLARRLPENVLLVIAGRTVPAWDRAWPGWMRQAAIVELQEMTSHDLRTLVRRYYAYIRRGEPDPEQVEAIVGFSRGLPVAAATVVQLWVRHGVEDFQTVKPQVVADLVDRLLEGVPPEMRPVFEVAAVLRYFNAESLRALLGEGDTEKLYDELRRWPFIRPRREGLAVHDAMREMMIEALYVRSPERFRALHERATTYFETQRAEATGAERERLTLELLYHSLQADETQGIAVLERLFGEADRFRQQELEGKLLEEASHHPFQDPQHRYRLRLLRARTEKSWSGREGQYKELLSEDLDDAIRPAVLRGLGESLSFQHKPDEARRYLEEALALCERLGNPIETGWTRLELCWGIKDLDESRNHINLALEAFREAGDEYGMAVAELELGYNYLNRWQAVEARDAFARSMVLQDKLGHQKAAAQAQERIGQAYLIEGDFQQATVPKQEALKVFEKLQDEWNIAWTLDELATCYSFMGQWEVALVSLERARRVFAEWGDHRETACVVRQGEIYRKQGRLELALDRYQYALNSMPMHNVWASQEIYAGMGHIHLIHGEFEQALADYQRAIAQFRDRGMELEARMIGDLYLGGLFFEQGRWSDAAEHYAVSLEAARLAGSHASECLALVGMSQANYEQRDLGQLDDLISQVEELGDKYGYHQFLAEIRVLQGHIALDRALVDREHLATALGFYRAALEEALCYNRYELDETVQAIIARCHERGVEGKQVLMSINGLWQTEANSEGMPLLKAERIAREREPGDGSRQASVVEQIEQVLKEV